MGEQAEAARQAENNPELTDQQQPERQSVPQVQSQVQTPPFPSPQSTQLAALPMQSLCEQSASLEHAPLTDTTPGLLELEDDRPPELDEDGLPALDEDGLPELLPLLSVAGGSP
jgi:hypothetical protein